MKKIEEITPIEKSRNQTINTRKKLESLVESPLLPACQNLYDLNIRTFSTSANIKDVGQEAYIIIDYGTLSEENKKIANEISTIGDYDGTKSADIRIPLGKNVEEREFQNLALNIVNRFEYQEMTWATKYTFDEVLDIFAIKDRTQFTAKEIESQTGMFYDSKNDLFYLSQEHFQKVNSSKDE